ncbi:MAG: hypothetical protein P1V36_17380, partial [Planctomycetota bacterium]|nr:hypothetical protein [Planctomycetota bacterium]
MSQISRFPRSPRRRQDLPCGPQRGVAMLIVITILVTMVLIALPFALSMNQGKERTKAVGARTRARFEAETLLELAKLHLIPTTEWQ